MNKVDPDQYNNIRCLVVIFALDIVIFFTLSCIITNIIITISCRLVECGYMSNVDYLEDAQSTGQNYDL